jgi:hypothetical protein
VCDGRIKIEQSLKLLKTLPAQVPTKKRPTPSLHRRVPFFPFDVPVLLVRATKKASEIAGF